MTSSPSSAPARGRLLQVLGVGFGLAVIIGNTIGAGILRTPGEVATRLPTAALFIGIWIIGGLYALLGANALAELGTRLPRSGGQYVFARAALGEFAGFIVGWSDWISTCGTTAAVAMLIAEYTRVLFPRFPSGIILIGCFVTTFFAILQWRGVRWGQRTQEMTGLLKTLAFIAIVVACFTFGGTRQLVVPPAMPASLLLSFVLALQAVIYTYDGWAGAIYFSEEVRNPRRDIPRSLLGGVGLIIGIYLAVNLALLYVMPIGAIAGQKLAVGAAAGVVFGALGDPVIRSLVIISMLSGINAYHLMATRVVFAMSRDGLFWRRMSEVNEGGTPAWSLLASTLVALLFILSGTFDQVIAVLAFFFVANYTLSFISLFILRRKNMGEPNHYTAWGHPWTTALALIGSVAFLAGAIWSDSRNSVFALITLALSYPVFLLFRKVSHPM